MLKIEPVSSAHNLRYPSAVSPNFTKLAEFKHIFLDWSTRSKFDPYSKIFEYAHALARLFWLGILLAFAGMTAFLVILNLFDYFNYDVVSQIQIVTQRPATFPAVTLCDNNPFTTSQSHEFMYNLMLSVYGEDISTNLTFFPASYRIGDITTKAKLLASLPSANESFRKQMGFAFERIFVCTFNGIACNLSNDFHWYYSFENGNCWQYNSGLNLANEKTSLAESTTEGKYFGLSLMIVGLANRNPYPVVNSKGITLFVHNQSFWPIASEGIQIQPGSDTNIAVKRTFSSRQPVPYSQCVDLTQTESKIYKYIREATNQSYRQRDCLDLCRQERIIAVCLCYYPKYSMISRAEPCLNDSQMACVSSQFNFFTGDVLRECLAECPLECDTVTYDFQLSSSLFPNKELYTLLFSDPGVVAYFEYLSGAVLTYESFKEMSYQINVFYPYMEYTEISEKPKTSPIDLFSQVGGSLGIFCGFSMFHLLEIVEILYLFVYAMLQ